MTLVIATNLVLATFVLAVVVGMHLHAIRLTRAAERSVGRTVARLPGRRQSSIPTRLAA